MIKKVNLLVIVVGLLLALGQVHAKKGGQGNGGSDKGGFGSLGDGCVTFISPPGLGTPGSIHEDGGWGPESNTSYCNGTDGQVSVPVRIRMDTKKFNSHDRAYLVDAICSTCLSRDLTNNSDCDDILPEAETVCTSQVEAVRFQMGNEYDSETLARGEGLDWTMMDPPSDGTYDVTRAGLGVTIDKDHSLSFSNENNDRGCFDNDPILGESSAQPVWVRCEGDANGDDFCDQWTVSTYELPTNGSWPTSSSASVNACLKAGIFEMLDPDVFVDFTFSVCVMGLGITGCP